MQISSLYCLKTFGAFCVICIHCYQPIFLVPIVKTAVPIFFIITGFFLYNDNRGVTIKNCLRSIIKIFWITIYANLFFYFVNILPKELIPFHSLKKIIKFILIGDGIGFHLWYLNALIESLIVILFFIYIKKLRYLWMCIPFFLIVGLLTGSYARLGPLPNHYLFSRNFITMGIPCIGIGWLIKQNLKFLMTFLHYPLLITTFVGFIACLEIFIFEYYNFYSEYKGDYFLMTIPLSTLLFLLCIKNPNWGKNNFFEIIGKKYSTFIYVFHIFILWIIWKFMDNFIAIPRPIVPILTFIFTILFVKLWKFASIKTFGTKR